MSMGRPRDGIPPVPQHMKIAEYQNTAPAPLNGVLIKMGLFTLAMVILPIGSYYLSRDYYFGSNLTGSGMTAATVANLILAAFVITAIREDGGEPQHPTTTAAAETKSSKGSTATTTGLSEGVFNDVKALRERKK
ncbi:BQ2448_5031 [Microbotryum intermedium]|uniref:BQ2448_5031 protein n=1 Tax=Microbotryum intermedium TaxID=269621 RepID=A0A238EZW9_9BASI|nr:BQ2448_5031 [Microbotryum intermedium]